MVHQSLTENAVQRTQLRRARRTLPEEGAGKEVPHHQDLAPAPGAGDRGVIRRELIRFLNQSPCLEADREAGCDVSIRAAMTREAACQAATATAHEALILVIIQMRCHADYVLLVLQPGFVNRNGSLDHRGSLRCHVYPAFGGIMEMEESADQLGGLRSEALTSYCISIRP
jgi:hypothetical protein